MDNLSQELNKLRAGCFIGNVKFNHMFYADDLYCFCPGVIGLQDLMNGCAKYAVHHKIGFDASKSFGVLFHTLLTKSFKPIL